MIRSGPCSNPSSWFPCTWLNSKVFVQKGQSALLSPVSAALAWKVASGCSCQVHSKTHFNVCLLTDFRGGIVCLFATYRQNLAQSNCSITNRGCRGHLLKHSAGRGFHLGLRHPESLLQLTVSQRSSRFHFPAFRSWAINKGLGFGLMMGCFQATQC